MHAYKTHAKTMHLVKLVLRRRDTAVYALMRSEAHTVTKVRVVTSNSHAQSIGKSLAKCLPSFLSLIMIHR